MTDLHVVAEQAAAARGMYRHCLLCEHRCGVDRTAGGQGFCRAGSVPRLWRYWVDYAEEEPLAPSLLLYLSGCDLRCDCSFDRASGQSPLHTITAFATGMRVCLRQMSVEAKSNEIPAVRDLLKLMDLTGSTVTLDAMHCQVETARAIVDASADYILVVKANQDSLYLHLIDLFVKYCDAGHEASGLKCHKTTERSHGRWERREYFAVEVPEQDPVFRR